SAKRRAIFATEPKQLATTFKVKTGRWARISRNAGDYVCNYSIYLLLREIKRRKLAARLAFVHIPYDYDATKAGRFVREILRQCAPEKSEVGSRPRRPSSQQDRWRVDR
ncbi:MAG: pyroglutamyl-peptidase I family protein, partial [Candidatus Binatia bacterium]